MRSRRGWTAVALAVMVAAAAGSGCSDAFAPVTLTPPDSLVVQARSMRSALLEWPPVDDPNAIAYRVERRADFSGPFVTVADNIAQALPGPVFLLDDHLEPETFYGYRILVLDRFGGVSEPSVVHGIRTPPEPGIVVSTVSRLEAPDAADRDGYTVVIRRGTDSIVGALSPSGERRFGPLTPGDYAVQLRGLASNCAVDQGGMMRAAPVTDIGLETLPRVNYVISCSDPQLGRITATMDVTGENRDSNGVVLRLAGIHANVPDSLKVTNDSARFTGPDGGQRTWTGLRPGDFQITMTGLDAKCTVDGNTRSVQLVPQSDDTVHFTVTCPTPQTDTTTVTPGYQLRNTWGPVAGGKVTLTVTLDMGAYNDPAVNGNNPDDLIAIQGNTTFDGTKLRFASAASVSGSGLQNLAANGSRSGVVEWINFSTLSALQTGVQGIVTISFDVLGTGTVTTRTALSVAESQASADLIPHVVLRESAVNLSGTGGGSNTAPVARTGGPYSGAPGASVSFNGGTSSDADGTIAGYAWTFGDGGTGVGATPQHAYATAGSYQVSLTVTDNLGATGTATTTAVIVGGSGGNQSPVVHANGPYAGTAGSPITFSASGSSDPDGSIVSYAWSFGDGGSGSGTSAQHSYAAAGSYTATLTVTDDQGASAVGIAQVTVTASGGSATPFTWRYVQSGALKKDSIITLTVELDLTTDIAATPGVEELETFAVDSLKWNPAVLQYFSFNHGPGGFGSVQPNASAGRLGFLGTLGPVNRTGVITMAVIRFKVLGTPGATTTTQSTVGALTGTAATGSFSYRSRTAIQESTLTIQ